MTATDSRPRWGLGTALTLGMAGSTFAAFAIGALGPLITEDLGLSRARFGALTTVLFAVGAGLSPLAGRLVDTVGARRVLVAVFATAAGALVAAAIAPGYMGLLAAFAVAGVPMSGGNPATNKLVAVHLPLGGQGTIMGVKQSGVPLGAFAAGAVLPSLGVAIGWRPALATAAVIPLIGLVAAFAGVPRDGATTGGAPAGGYWRPVAWLVAYAFAMGLALAVITAYLPLYAHEAVGLSVPAAGAAAAVIGAIGVAARIVWGRLSDAAEHTSGILALLGAVSIAGVVAVWLADDAGPALLWVGVGATGVSAAAWNAVGMLAIVKDLGPRDAGRASGIVLLAFYGGYVFAPIAFGYARDATGSYDLGWAGVGAAYLLATVVATRRARRTDSPAATPAG